MFNLTSALVRNADGVAKHRPAASWAEYAPGLTRGRLKAGLILAGADAIAVILATLAVRHSAGAPANGPGFAWAEAFYIPLFLICGLALGLYAGFGPTPFERFRQRVLAITAFAGAELFLCALFQSIAPVLLYVGARALLLLPFSFYLEIAARRAFIDRNLWDAPAWSAGHGPGAAFDLERSAVSVSYPWLRRAMDLAVAIPAGLLMLPAIGILAAAIKIADPGPAFYVQSRPGRNGRTVPLLKLRSMYVNAEERLDRHLGDNPEAKAEWERCFKLRDDPRILRNIGHFIRCTSLDEVPQFWNVIRGDMALVGPRPFPGYHLDSFDSEFRKIRASVMPGLTGFWQISERSNGNLDTQKALDLFYIRNQSILLDLYIVLQTVPAVLSRSGAR